MKFWKGFSFFFIYPFTMMVIGFLGGVVFMDYFYPQEIYRMNGTDRAVYGEEQGFSGDSEDSRKEENYLSAGSAAEGQQGSDQNAGGFGDRGQEGGTGEEEKENILQADNGSLQAAQEPTSGQEESSPVISLGEKLDADTAYVLEETDLRNQSVVETTWELPEKYIGMNREEFLAAMDTYEMAPPLSELERGFVSLEVLSFSREKVVVQMNYNYIQPGSDFFLAVEDNYVVVYLEDKTTVYMDTDILLNELPDAVQQDVINWMYIPDEKSLYNFLESYSS